MIGFRQSIKHTICYSLVNGYFTSKGELWHLLLQPRSQECSVEERNSPLPLIPFEPEFQVHPKTTHANWRRGIRGQQFHNSASDSHKVKLCPKKPLSEVDGRKHHLRGKMFTLRMHTTIFRIFSFQFVTKTRLLTKRALPAFIETKLPVAS